MVQTLMPAAAMVWAASACPQHALLLVLLVL
jgi:hypothetical protein